MACATQGDEKHLRLETAFHGSIALPFVIPSAAEGSAVPRTFLGNVSIERSGLDCSLLRQPSMHRECNHPNLCFSNSRSRCSASLPKRLLDLNGSTTPLASSVYINQIGIGSFHG